MPARVYMSISFCELQMLDQGDLTHSPSAPQLYDLLPINSSILWSHHEQGLSQLGQSRLPVKQEAGRGFMQLT